MLFLTPLEFAQVVWRGMWQLWENAREVIVKMERTNYYYDKYMGKTKTKTARHRWGRFFSLADLVMGVNLW